MVRRQVLLPQIHVIVEVAKVAAVADVREGGAAAVAVLAAHIVVVYVQAADIVV